MTLNSRPLADRSFPPEAVKTLIPIVGQIITSWAFADSQLTMWIAMSFPLGGDQIKPDIPKEFSRRKRYLKKCFNQISLLGAFRDEALECFAIAERHQRIRHFIAHGIPSDYRDEEEELFTFVKLDIGSDKVAHVMDEITISLSDLQRSVDELQKLSDRAVNLSFRIMNALYPQYNANDIIRGL